MAGAQTAAKPCKSKAVMKRVTAKVGCRKGLALLKWKWIKLSLQSHRRESVFMYGADRVVLAREDAGSASNIMLPMNFVPFLHNLFYMDFRVVSSHTFPVPYRNWTLVLYSSTGTGTRYLCSQIMYYSTTVNCWIPFFVWNPECRILVLRVQHYRYWRGDEAIIWVSHACSHEIDETIGVLVD